MLYIKPKYVNGRFILFFSLLFFFLSFSFFNHLLIYGKETTQKGTGTYVKILKDMPNHSKYSTFCISFSFESDINYNIYLRRKLIKKYLLI